MNAELIRYKKGAQPAPLYQSAVKYSPSERLRNKFRITPVAYLTLAKAPCPLFNF